MSGQNNAPVPIKGEVGECSKRKNHTTIWRPVSRTISPKISFATQAGGDMSQSHQESFHSDSVGELKATIDAPSSETRTDFPCQTSKHSISLVVGTPLVRFVKGDCGSTQKKIEQEMGVKLIFSSTKEETSIIIEGISVESVDQALMQIRNVIEEALKDRSLDYSHFISFPLSTHVPLTEKLINFQNCILDDSNFGQGRNSQSNSEEYPIDHQQFMSTKQESAGINTRLDLQEDNCVKVDIDTTSKCIPKELKPSALSEFGLDRSIFIKPKTFHLTVLMLKLYEKDRIDLAINVLQSVSSKVKDALGNKPVFIRLKGLACMRGSPAKASVIYAPVEEISQEGRLLLVCRIIIDAYLEAGFISKEDAQKELKLHATLMNMRHMKRKKRTKKFFSFDARDIFEKFGSEEWGELAIQEVHLSQRFKFDEKGYYHCCTSIPLPTV